MMINSSIIHRLASSECVPVVMIKADPKDDELMSLSINGAHFIFRKDASWQLIDLIASVAGDKHVN